MCVSSSSTHYGKQGLCRVFPTLPSAKYRALGKGRLCRVPHSAKTNTRHIHLCRVPGTRQSLPLPSVGLSAKLNTRQRLFCRVPSTRQNIGTRQTLICRVSGPRQTRALGKYCQRHNGPNAINFAECQALGTRQIIKFVECHGLALGKFFLFWPPFFW